MPSAHLDVLVILLAVFLVLIPSESIRIYLRHLKYVHVQVILISYKVAVLVTLNIPLTKHLVLANVKVLLEFFFSMRIMIFATYAHKDAHAALPGVIPVYLQHPEKSKLTYKILKFAIACRDLWRWMESVYVKKAIKK